MCVIDARNSCPHGSRNETTLNTDSIVVVYSSSVCVCVCVRACVRASVHVCMCVVHNSIPMKSYAHQRS